MANYSEEVLANIPYQETGQVSSDVIVDLTDAAAAQARVEERLRSVREARTDEIRNVLTTTFNLPTDSLFSVDAQVGVDYVEAFNNLEAIHNDLIVGDQNAQDAYIAEIKKYSPDASDIDIAMMIASDNPAEQVRDYDVFEALNNILDAMTKADEVVVPKFPDIKPPITPNQFRAAYPISGDKATELLAKFGLSKYEDISGKEKFGETQKEYLAREGFGQATGAGYTPIEIPEISKDIFTNIEIEKLKSYASEQNLIIQSSMNTINNAIFKVISTTKLKKYALQATDEQGRTYLDVLNPWLESAYTSLLDKAIGSAEEGITTGAVSLDPDMVNSFFDITTQNEKLSNLLGMSGMVDIAVRAPDYSQEPYFDVAAQNNIFATITDSEGSGVRGSLIASQATNMGISLHGDYKNALYQARLDDIQAYGLYGEQKVYTPPTIGGVAQLGKLPGYDSFMNQLKLSINKTLFGGVRSGQMVSESIALRGLPQGSPPSMGIPITQSRGIGQNQGLDPAIDAAFPAGSGRSYQGKEETEQESSEYEDYMSKARKKRTGFQGIVYRRRK